MIYVNTYNLLMKSIGGQHELSESRILPDRGGGDERDASGQAPPHFRAGPVPADRQAGAGAGREALRAQSPLHPVPGGQATEGRRRADRQHPSAAPHGAGRPQ